VPAGFSFAREGELLHLQGKTEESLRVLSAGARRFPRDVTGRLVLARVCRESGRQNEARDWLESVLRDDASCPAARLQLAEILGGVEGEYHFGVLRAQEPWDEGFGDVATAESAAPVFSEPGSVYAFDEEEEDDAEAEIDIDSLPHVATVTLAEIYLQQGLKEQAAQIYRQLLERQPGDASVRARLEAIESGDPAS
jgi:thioredoxin-like negative regulator of GroEL